MLNVDAITERNTPALTLDWRSQDNCVIGSFSTFNTARHFCDRVLITSMATTTSYNIFTEQDVFYVDVRTGLSAFVKNV